jgi:hypothetical protein
MGSQFGLHLQSFCYTPELKILEKSVVARKVWNLLPQATRQAKIVSAFKTALETGLTSAVTV